MVGTDTYKKYTDKMNNIYNQSNCHTLDRDNLQAQRDLCGVNSITDDWKLAVD